MGLSREQYDRIRQVYQNRRISALYAQEARRAEVFAALPEMEEVERSLSEQAVLMAKAKLSGNAKALKEMKEQRESLLRKKLRLLSKGGFAQDYLDVKPVCSICGDTGYADGRKCACLKKLESELLYAGSGLPQMLSRENFDTFRLDVFDNTDILPALEPRYRITQRIYMQTQVLPIARKYAAQFDADLNAGKGQNLLFTGPSGTGKTFLTNCIAKSVIDSCHTVLYLNAGEMFDDLSRESFGKEPAEGSGAPGLRDIESCDLLIIDDLGTEMGSGFTNSRLFMIISHRLLQRLSTIISTNLTLNQLSRVYGDRVVSRLMEGYLKIPFYGRDLRIRKR